MYCYNIIKPRNVLPIHGEAKHLHANAALAIRTGVDPEHVIGSKDGMTIDLIL